MSRHRPPRCRSFGVVRVTAVLAATLLLQACNGPRTATDSKPLASGSPAAPGGATPAHHTLQGFKNNYIGAVDKPFGDLLKWKWDAFWADLPQAPRQPTPTQPPDLPAIQANARAGAAMRPMVTWIGHASTLVQASGLNVLTDPVFSERASPVQLFGPKRQQPPGIALHDLPPIDVVVISHNHFDHLDRQSVFALDQRAKAADPSGKGRTLFLVPLGLKAWFVALGIEHVVELDWWQKHSVASAGGAVNFYLTPVQHWSARGLNDRSTTLWGGWSVFGPGFHWYFSGDAGYSPDFTDTRRRFEVESDKLPTQANATNPASPNRTAADRAGRQPLFDLALIAIGAYAPRWFMAAQHLNPGEAAQAHLDLDAARSIGVHWGTFNLTDEALDQPPLDLAAARRAHGLADDVFVVLKIGQSRVFGQRRP